MYTLYEYPKCSTCKKAKAWLDQQGVKYQAIDIKATPPALSAMKPSILAAINKITSRATSTPPFLFLSILACFLKKL